MAEEQEVVIVSSGRSALVLEARPRSHNRSITPKVDYRLGVRLPTGAIKDLGWYYEDEIRAAGEGDTQP